MGCSNLGDRVLKRVDTNTTTKEKNIDKPGNLSLQNRSFEFGAISFKCGAKTGVLSGPAIALGQGFSCIGFGSESVACAFGRKFGSNILSEPIVAPSSGTCDTTFGCKSRSGILSRPTIALGRGFGCVGFSCRNSAPRYGRGSSTFDFDASAFEHGIEGDQNSMNSSLFYRNQECSARVCDQLQNIENLSPVSSFGQ